MSRLTPAPGWPSRVGSALVVVLAVAIGARVIWYLLAPVLPIVIAGAFIFGLAMLLFRRRS